MDPFLNRRKPSVALAAFAASAALWLTGVQAQSPAGPDTTSSTAEDSTGKVTAVAPNQSISVTSRRGPFTYRLGRDLHVVGPDGKPMKITGVHVGETVTVYYYQRDGQSTVARIAVLKETAAKR